MAINRSEIYLVDLEPTTGSASHKSRPCLVVSPDEMNHHIRTVMVAPLTSHASNGRRYPTRVKCRFAGTDGLVVLDQLRTLDASRLLRRLGHLDSDTMDTVLTTLDEMFAA